MLFIMYSRQAIKAVSLQINDHAMGKPFSWEVIQVQFPGDYPLRPISPTLMWVSRLNQKRLKKVVIGVLRPAF